MMKPWPVYPFLFGLYPPLALYAREMELLLFEYTLGGFAVVLVITVVLFLLFFRMFRSVYRTGIIISVVLAFLFVYGPVYELANGLVETTSGGLLRHRYVLPVWILSFGILGIWTVLSRSSFVAATKPLNVSAIVLIALPSMGIAAHLMSASGNAQHSVRTTPGEEATNLEVVGKPRDIYYLIFDRYAAESTLRDEYNFDNRPFLNFMRDRGFYIAHESAANYLNTAPSLASSLNMEYINHLSDDVGKASGDWRPLLRSLQSFRVWRLLKEHGYKYIHLGSWWQPTARNENADENFDVRFDQFTRALLRPTPLWMIGRELGLPWFDSRAEWLCRREPVKFRKLREIARRGEPTFVFAHFLIPHEPYVFDADGSCLTGEEARTRTERTLYLGQLQYANAELRKLVDALLRESDVAPIIVIQADEGPYPSRYKNNEIYFDWRTSTEGELREKLGIINAHYLPGVHAEDLHKKITPVNTFRVIFNEYFNGNFEILPDKSYAYVNQRRLYDFFDVTDAID